jgi:CRP/FNR family transcriptional regulator, anaerobic regulatory protein
MITSLQLPMIRALSLTGVDVKRPLLTDQQRRRLADAATILQLPARAIIYRDGDPADSIFINGGGVVISFKDMPSGKRRVAGFRYYADIFGLADHGKYVNTTRSVTPVTIYQIPIETLTALLRQDGDLEFQFVCKLVHELRQAQRKAIIVARRDAPGRIAMFVDMLRRRADVEGPPQDVVELPMSRSDIGDFLNLAHESVSRGCKRLSNMGVIEFKKGTARILDRARFDKVVAKT